MPALCPKIKLEKDGFENFGGVEGVGVLDSKRLPPLDSWCIPWSARAGGGCHSALCGLGKSHGALYGGGGCHWHFAVCEEGMVHCVILRVAKYTMWFGGQDS